MITIEEAKKLGFYEYQEESWYKPYWSCDLGEMSLQLYPDTMFEKCK